MNARTRRHIASGLSFSSDKGLVVRTTTDGVHSVGTVYVWSKSRNEIVTSRFEGAHELWVYIYSVPDTLSATLSAIWTSVRPHEDREQDRDQK